VNEEGGVKEMRSPDYTKAVDFDLTFLPYLLFGNWERRLKMEILAYPTMSFRLGWTLESKQFFWKKRSGNDGAGF
jgi:hypothetical protein